MVSVVLFDLDGVLVDSEELSIRASNEVLGAHGIVRTKEELSRVFGRRSLDNYTELIEFRGLDLDPRELVSEKEEFYFKLIQGNLEPKQGVVDLIEELEESGFLIAVVSSSGLERLERTLIEIGLIEEFDLVVSGDCCEIGKPDPAPYLHAAKELGVDVRECIVIEDAEAGVKSGKAAGMKVVAVRNKNTHGQDLGSADLVVSELSEVNLSVLNSL